MRDLKEVWVAFERGDLVTDKELLALHKQSKQALQYLSDRRPSFDLAWRQAIKDNNNIEYYLHNRGLMKENMTWRPKPAKRRIEHARAG